MVRSAMVTVLIFLPVTTPTTILQANEEEVEAMLAGGRAGGRLAGKATLSSHFRFWLCHFLVEQRLLGVLLASPPASSLARSLARLSACFRVSPAQQKDRGIGKQGTREVWGVGERGDLRKGGVQGGRRIDSMSNPLLRLVDVSSRCESKKGR